MYDAQHDEASIMQHTGNKSVNGVCTYKRSTEKICELTLAILNQSDNLNREETNTKDVQTNEQKENTQQVCPSIPAMPWNFESASSFTINLKFK